MGGFQNNTGKQEHDPVMRPIPLGEPFATVVEMRSRFAEAERKYGRGKSMHDQEYMSRLRATPKSVRCDVSR